ncbi:hypothetical protein C1645_841303 [Glomus cerebriforme]|uniref:Uncharacterized protein n=1 Tax=Glomus cerebriforme TaxID=658196 RepID=A0A397S5C7_9GLOM|nr:hypothetical protein C1645_841303 [Glomus cerebriforme]
MSVSDNNHPEKNELIDTSGNPNLDEFIKKTQHAKYCDDFIEWILFSNLGNTKMLTRVIPYIVPEVLRRKPYTVQSNQNNNVGIPQRPDSSLLPKLFEEMRELFERIQELPSSELDEVKQGQEINFALYIQPEKKPLDSAQGGQTLEIVETIVSRPATISKIQIKPEINIDEEMEDGKLSIDHLIN